MEYCHRSARDDIHHCAVIDLAPDRAKTPYSAQMLRLVKPILRPTGVWPRAMRSVASSRPIATPASALSAASCELNGAIRRKPSRAARISFRAGRIDSH
jgi:hypothetical protein